ncbi:uncharacterized protein LOC128214982 [Mya arenaria]|uniref:uncharacterized protein LOC128214982 n=1 Tax=Mya arenaria TaxID=6604 RepID=UPI0022E1F0DD|nr:uncharacterized protein LOC128214982 [Mya arenaria]
MAAKEIFSMVLCLLLGTALVASQTIQLRATHTCSEEPNNLLRMDLRVRDDNGVAVRLSAVNSINETQVCSVSGSGSETSPFVVLSKVNKLTDSAVQNRCGMTAGSSGIYTWLFKAFTYNEGQTGVFQHSFLLRVVCDSSQRDGNIETIINFDVPNLRVNALNPSDVTGVDAVAVNSLIQYEAILYPESTVVPILENAEGFWLYNCYSSTNPGRTQNRELFINSNGCREPNAAYAPSTNPVAVATSGDALKVVGNYATATVVDGKKVIYIDCLVGICLLPDDSMCDNRCSAFGNGETLNGNRINTGSTFSTLFTVQNLQAQLLVPLAEDGATVVKSADVNDFISLRAYNAPNGIDAPAAIQNAKGFYAYNCIYAENAGFNNAVQFIDNFGCVVPNTKLSALSGFEYNPVLSVPSSDVYVLDSGRILISNVGNLRLWAKCRTGICTAVGHNYCTVGRCGSSNNIPGGAQDLGDQGLDFTLSILDIITSPAIDININNDNGNDVGNNGLVTVGDRLALQLVITPRGQGVGSGAFNGAKAAFLYDCTIKINGGPAQPVLDGNGCRDPNSPITLSDTCRDATMVPGVEPFTVQCGTYAAPEGDSVTDCRVGYCDTEDNPFCVNRCQAGVITPEYADSIYMPDGLSASAAFVAAPRTTTTITPVPTQGPRTAEKSKELNDIIMAVSVVAGLLLLLGVLFGTLFIVRQQRNRAKRLDDRRDYDYRD